MAGRFGVRQTPTLLLIHRDREGTIPVGIGPVSYPKLTQNVYRGIRLLEGETAPEQYFMLGFEEGTPLDPLSVPEPLFNRGGVR